MIPYSPARKLYSESNLCHLILEIQLYSIRQLVAETPLSVEDAAAAGIKADSREAAEYKRRGWDLIETSN